MPDKGKGKIKKVVKKVVNTIRNEVRALGNTPIKVAKRTNNNRNSSLMNDLRIARENKKGRSPVQGYARTPRRQKGEHPYARRPKGQCH